MDKSLRPTRTSSRDWAYFAGLLDADGWITFATRPSPRVGPYTIPALGLVQADEGHPAIACIAALLRAKRIAYGLGTYAQTQLNVQARHILCVKQQESLFVLLQHLLPHLQAKRDLATTASQLLAARLNQRHRKLPSRPPSPMTATAGDPLAYVAGFLDGDGCITFSVRGSGPRKYRVPALIFTQVDQGIRTLDRLESVLRSNGIRYAKTRYASRNPRWQARNMLAVKEGKSLDTILRAVLPFLTNKRERCEEALATLKANQNLKGRKNLHRPGLPIRRKRFWSLVELAALRRLDARNQSDYVIAEALQRTINSVAQKRRRLKYDLGAPVRYQIERPTLNPRGAARTRSDGSPTPS